MFSVPSLSSKVWGLTAALVFVAWTAAGLYQGLHSGFSGGLYDPEYRIVGVVRGGLAERSGFKAGDRVISVEGRPVEQLGMESRWPRFLVPRIGETRRFVVERESRRIPIEVVFPAPSAAAVNNRIAAALLGLAFLGCGLWALLAIRSPHARAVANIGLVAGLAMALDLGPSLGSWSGVQGHLSTAANVLMFILLLRFSVTFPALKRVSASRIAAGLVYGAWGCLLLFLLAELIVHPALYYSTGSVASAVILAYVILILAALTHTVVTTPRADLRAAGMYLIFGGVLTPIVFTVIVNVSGVRLPSWAYALATAAIPLTMLLAVRKQARREDAAAKPLGIAA